MPRRRLLSNPCSLMINFIEWMLKESIFLMCVVLEFSSIQMHACIDSFRFHVSSMFLCRGKHLPYMIKWWWVMMNKQMPTFILNIQSVISGSFWVLLPSWLPFALFGYTGIPEGQSHFFGFYLELFPSAILTVVLSRQFLLIQVFDFRYTCGQLEIPWSLVLIVW